LLAANVLWVDKESVSATVHTLPVARPFVVGDFVTIKGVGSDVPAVFNNQVRVKTVVADYEFTFDVPQ
jgi:hypothetical protein